jgi:excisionase family DNA binding protein
MNDKCKYEHQTFLKPDEVADLLRTSRKAIYAMVERGLIPGVVRLGRRVLIRNTDLLEWLRQKSAPSPSGRSER